jgi:hypothetical protein
MIGEILRKTTSIDNEKKLGEMVKMEFSNCRDGYGEKSQK